MRLAALHPIHTAPPALQLAAALPAGARTALMRLAALRPIHTAPPALQLAAALPAGARTALESRGNSKQLRCLKFDACYNRKRFYFC